MAGVRHQIEISEDLHSWRPVIELPAAPEGAVVSLPDVPVMQSLFFRAVQEPGEAP
jgi:hypothetical protein